MAKDIKTYESPDLFVATPPIESSKFLLRSAAQDKSLSIMRVNVTRAYVFAIASRSTHVRLPTVDR